MEAQFHSNVAQLEEHLIEDQGVAGSTPATGASPSAGETLKDASRKTASEQGSNRASMKNGSRKDVIKTT